MWLVAEAIVGRREVVTIDLTAHGRLSATTFGMKPD